MLFCNVAKSAKGLAIKSTPQQPETNPASRSRENRSSGKNTMANTKENSGMAALAAPAIAEGKYWVALAKP